MDETTLHRRALEWQVSIWNGISQVYVREIDRRFTPVVEGVLARANLAPGARVLDLGTGTGAVAERAARLVGPGGHVVATDISTEMLAVARARMAASRCVNVTLLEGAAENIPAASHDFDVVLASLCLMFVIDREAAAREIARVLRPMGRFVAAVWGGPDRCDIVRFQQIAGRFAGPPPVSCAGPGSMADPHDFLHQLAAAGIDARVETEILGFEFQSFDAAWDTLARVTTAHLAPELQADAKAAVRAAMYPAGDGPFRFSNLTQFIVGGVRPGP
jgi:SAM-dependent methyltransferase